MPKRSVFFKQDVSRKNVILFGEGVTQLSEHMSPIRLKGKDAREEGRENTNGV